MMTVVAAVATTPVATDVPTEMETVCGSTSCNGGGADGGGGDENGGAPACK